MFQDIVTAWRVDRGCSRMLEHAKLNLIQQPSSSVIVVTSLFNLVISSFPDNMFYRMNNAVDLSWWFQQRCSSLLVHQAVNSLFQHTRDGGAGGAGGGAKAPPPPLFLWINFNKLRLLCTVHSLKYLNNILYTRSKYTCIVRFVLRCFLWRVGVLRIIKNQLHKAFTTKTAPVITFWNIICDFETHLCRLNTRHESELSELIILTCLIQLR